MGISRRHPHRATPEEIENGAITGQFGFSCVWGKLGQGSFSFSFLLHTFYRKHDLTWDDIQWYKKNTNIKLTRKDYLVVCSDQSSQWDFALVSGKSQDHCNIINVFEMFGFETQSQHFQLPPVWRVFSKRSAFRDELVWKENKTPDFSDFSGYCGRGDIVLSVNKQITLLFTKTMRWHEEYEWGWIPPTPTCRRFYTELFKSPYSKSFRNKVIFSMYKTAIRALIA